VALVLKYGTFTETFTSFSLATFIIIIIIIIIIMKEKSRQTRDNNE